jgi:hypothetical protein
VWPGFEKVGMESEGVLEEGPTAAILPSVTWTKPDSMVVSPVKMRISRMRKVVMMCLLV